jgi:Icc-related predicted phosphoesterase
MTAFFVSDLHGKRDRYLKLFDRIISYKPHAVFFGGDLFPSFKEMLKEENNFFENFFVHNFENLKQVLKDEYSQVFIILGNDDPKIEEIKFKDTKYSEYWNYINNSKAFFDDFEIYGYSYIPPTPFINKDWELYDVSRYIDPGCIHPIEGKRSVDPERDIEFSTIKKDIEVLICGFNPQKSIFLFHSPPYQTNLDRAALDDMYFDYVPLDVNIGSIAIKEFIEESQPYLTLHGHVHESTRITGNWMQITGNTVSFNAAIDSDKLSIIIFDLNNPKNGRQEIL